MSIQVKTGVVRLSFANLYEPKAAPGSTEEKYSAQLIIDKEDETTLNALKAAIEAAKEAGKSKLQKNGKWKTGLKQTLRDGDTDPQTSDNPIYAGKMFMNCSSKTKPGLVGKKDGAIIRLDGDNDKGKVYSGCYAKVTLNAFAFDTNGSAGVSFGLNNVLFVKDGDALAGKPSAEADFADETDENDDFLS